MIIIEKARIKYCNLCCSTDEDIISVCLKHEGASGGQTIQLCDNCRKELVKVLKEGLNKALDNMAKQ